MAERIKTINVPIYDADVTIIVTDSTMKSINKRFNCKHDVDVRGYAIGEYGIYHLLLLTKNMDMNVLAHEIFHVTHRISEWANLHFDESHHEATAQINGFLFNSIYPFVKRYLNG